LGQGMAAAVRPRMVQNQTIRISSILGLFPILRLLRCKLE